LRLPPDGIRLTGIMDGYARAREPVDAAQAADSSRATFVRKTVTTLIFASRSL
jgi:hypothetical protein